MIKALAATAVLVGTLAFGGTAAPGTSCTPRFWRSGAATYQQFCGPARATAKINGSTLNFRGGKCAIETVQGRPAFSINVGTITLGRRVSVKYPYFGITVFDAPRDGTYRAAAITLQQPTYSAKSITSQGMVRLEGNRSRGTFSGSAPGGATIAGSFGCR